MRDLVAQGSSPEPVATPGPDALTWFGVGVEEPKGNGDTIRANFGVTNRLIYGGLTDEQVEAQIGRACEDLRVELQRAAEQVRAAPAPGWRD